ncbi:PH domain-containing protein [Actinokineospora diospyrosa]|uniref:PH domain-containing protein n=1 Tax=Actinokineospora diospyrosa TaxID=103728 RepID=UPI0020A29C69|nr:PH domain-containing protein [Actinokineospora diospyrosa]
MSEQQQVPSRLVFRIPGVAVLAALLFAVCATPFAFAAPGLFLVYVIPIAAVVWVLRVRTVADADGLVVREVTSSRPLPWDRLKGLRLSERGKVSAVLYDDTEVALPQVRVRHLPALALVSGGRLDDPTEPPTPEARDTDDADDSVGTGDSTAPTAGAAADPGVEPDTEPATEPATEPGPEPAAGSGAEDTARRAPAPE